MSVSDRPPIPTNCPTWCVADHEAQQHAEDRWHQSVGRLLPLVELRTPHIDEAWTFEAEPLDLHVVLEQRVGADMPYVQIGSEERERGFSLSVESIQRLVTELTVALDLAK